MQKLISIILFTIFLSVISFSQNITECENGTYLYMSGKFDNSNSAVEHKNKLVEMGYKDAFIVKLNNK